MATWVVITSTMIGVCVCVCVCFVGPVQRKSTNGLAIMQIKISHGYSGTSFTVLETPMAENK